MKKLLNGIVKFRREVLPNYRDVFSHLALGQSPDALFISCSDSRVAVNVFASTDPGDLFVSRNVGNFVPPFRGENERNASDSVSAAVEFALHALNVSSIIVCGHSECGAMQALVSGRAKIESAYLRDWLSNGDVALKTLDSTTGNNQLARHNQLSQLNVLAQIENLKTYPAVQAKLKAGTLTLYAWWFELKQADVYSYEEATKEFTLIDEEEAARIIERMK